MKRTRTYRSNQIHPPKAARWILERIVDEYTGYTAMGDFEEEFHYNAENRSLPAARLLYWCQIAVVLPVFIVQTFSWSVIMIKNYIKVAIRNTIRYKGYSFINIFGLSIGIACCMLIVLWVQDELSYDRFNENAGRLCRVV